MRILSISANNFKRNKQNFNAKLLVAGKARKLMNNICPSEVISDMTEMCQKSTANVLLKLEQATKVELGKSLNGLSVSAYRGSDKTVVLDFIPAKSAQDIECIVATIGEYLRQIKPRV